MATSQNYTLSIGTRFVEANPNILVGAKWGDSNVTPREKFAPVQIPTVPSMLGVTRLPLITVLRKETVGLLTAGFLAYIGLSALSPIVAYGGIALAALYVLRNYFD